MTLSIWIVTTNHAEAPGWFFAFRHEVDDNGEAVATDDVRRARTLEALRALLPDGLFQQDRDSDDDAEVVEIWY